MTTTVRVELHLANKTRVVLTAEDVDGIAERLRSSPIVRTEVTVLTPPPVQATKVERYELSIEQRKGPSTRRSTCDGLPHIGRRSIVGGRRAGDKS